MAKKVRLLYDYLGKKFVEDQNGTDWVVKDGVFVKGVWVDTWYKGTETVFDFFVKDRIKDLSEITNEQGKKKYKDITILN